MNKNAPDNRNIILAVVLSMIVFVGWEYFIVRPQQEAQRQQQIEQQEAREAQTQTPSAPGVAPPSLAGTASAPTAQQPEAILAGDAARVTLDSDTVDGSIRLTGARFDDLRLKAYHEDVDPKSPEIVFLTPQGANLSTYGEMGWTTGGTSNVAVPTAKTLWTVRGNQTLTPTTPVTLTWDNGQGLLFTRKIELDKDYMFTITDTVENKSGSAVTLYPYASVARHGEPKERTTWVLHEGPVGVLDGTLSDPSYGDVRDKHEIKTDSSNGWLGITDKYWMAAVIPPQGEKFTGRYSETQVAGVDVFRADYLMGARTVAPAGRTQIMHRFFAGPKINSLVNAYEDKLGIYRFNMAIDWGWFFFLTKPMFLLLDWLYHLIGNFGIAILALTVVIKAALFPLANRSYESMTKMKKIQPQIKELQERWKEDKVKLQQEQMELFRREKINPMMGCLPIVVQIPVFFSLYKVLYVTIEMRHAPFFGWIHDLASADPTNVFTLFGLLPFTAPVWLHLGIWPLLMGFTMWLQMRLNPPATDPVQQQMMTFMPFFMTYLMSAFPAGLVIYWTWNNILSMSQQYIIMRRMKVPVQLNLPAWLKLKPKPASPGE
ncbi:MAG: membrane protein insertase YidC [Alphaproteobacteria bacterium]|nr:membrane protein insertase YidC [Alphaproteobacteria bacterium]